MSAVCKSQSSWCLDKLVTSPLEVWSCNDLNRYIFLDYANSEPDVLIIDEALAVGDVFLFRSA